MKKIALFVIAIAAPLSALSAQPETATTTDATPAAHGEQATTSEQAERRPAVTERRICRRVDTTGSRTGGQRVCMTAEEWRRADY